MNVYLHSPVLHSSLGESLDDAVGRIRTGGTPFTRPFFQHELGARVPYFALEHQLPIPERLQLLLEQMQQAYHSDFTDQLLIVASSTLDIPAHEHNTRSRGLFQAEESTPLRQTAQRLQQAFGFADSFVLNTACSSAANALIYGQKLLQQNRFKAITLVAFEPPSQVVQQGFSALQLTSPCEEYRPFHANNYGLILGEVYAAAILSTEPEPRTLCQVLGGYSACDTSSVTGTREDGSHILQVMQRALQQAGCQPEQIDLIKLHGTGTPANDLAETLGTQQFLQHATQPTLCALKPWLGHTLGACGLSEVLLLNACLQQGIVPSTPADECHSLPLASTPAWHKANSLILANFFGFGGNNASLVLKNLDPEALCS